MPTFITMPEDHGDAESLGEVVAAAAQNAKAITEAIERERAENRAAAEFEKQRQAERKKQEETSVRAQGPKRATEIKMSPHDEGVLVRVGTLTVYERPDEGPMKHGHRAMVKEAGGRKLTGEAAFYRLYQELVK